MDFRKTEKKKGTKLEQNQYLKTNKMFKINIFLEILNNSNEIDQFPFLTYWLYIK